jgi:hypothetical protein
MFRLLSASHHQALDNFPNQNLKKCYSWWDPMNLAKIKHYTLIKMLKHVLSIKMVCPTNQPQLPTAIKDRQRRDHHNWDTTSKDKVNNPTGNNVTSVVSTRPPPTAWWITHYTTPSTNVVSRQPLYRTHFKDTLLDTTF